MDGVGEWATASIGLGTGSDARHCCASSASRTRSACSTRAFTYFTGFKVNSGEYKLMGLAPYGEPRYVDAHPATSSSSCSDDGSFRLDHGVLRLRARPDDDGRGVRAPLRRAAARRRSRS